MISRKNFLYILFKLILVMVSLISTPFYLYMAAFGYNYEGVNGHLNYPHLQMASDNFHFSQSDMVYHEYFYKIIEIIYGINFILNFLVEFVPENSIDGEPVRDLAKIAARYYHTELIWDVMALIPFNYFFTFKYSRFLTMIKCVRGRETAVMFDITNFRNNMKRLTDRYHQWAMD